MSVDALSPREEPTPQITLCVATRDRPELVKRHLLPCLRRLPVGSSVIVIDQSAGDTTANQLAELRGIVCLRTDEVGLSRARNLAVRKTRAPLLAFTDDDVSFEPSWLDQLVGLFDQYPDAGAVCGRAVTQRGERGPGAKPPGVYRWPTSPFGLGAGLNMALRRDALTAVGPFDEELGAGSTFPACEDTDMLYRVMRAGWSVVCSDEVVVTHHQWRNRREELRLYYAYGIGAGAQTAKHVSAGDWKAGWMGLRLQLHLPRTVMLLRPRYGLRLLAFSAGTVTGFLRWRRLHGSQRNRRID